MKMLTISGSDAGQRMDKYLKKYFRNATGGFLYKMLRKKNITLNGKKATGTEMLAAGDEIKVFFSDETFDKMHGAAQNSGEFAALGRVSHNHVHVVYEDEDILAVNKPAGMLSQKSDVADVSMNEEILSYLIETGALTEESYGSFHPSVANRLDRNTSGLLLAGKTLKGQQTLSGWLRRRDIVKMYHAVVKGHMTESAKISGYLYKDEANNKVEILDHEVTDAKPIETAYKPLAYGNGLTLVEVHLITGRSHQIRAHLASIGYPILGDMKYGDAKLNKTYRTSDHIRFQMLHSYSITMPDGSTIIAEDPKNFARVLKEV